MADAATATAADLHEALDTRGLVYPAAQSTGTDLATEDPFRDRRCPLLRGGEARG